MDPTSPARGASARYRTPTGSFVNDAADLHLEHRKASVGTTDGFVVVDQGRATHAEPQQLHVEEHDPSLSTGPRWQDANHDQTASSTSADENTRRQYMEQLGVDATAIWQQQTRLAAWRSQAFKVRNQLGYERKELYEQIDRLRLSVGDAYHKLKRLPDEPMPSVWLAHVKPDFELAREDWEQMEKQGKRVDALASELSRIEYEMEQEEGELAEAALNAINVLERLGFRLPLEARNEARLDVEQELSHEVDEHADTHPLLLDYYRQMGEAKVLTGRRVEFEADYEAARIEHIHKEEQEQPMDFSFEQFEESWERKRAPLQQALLQMLEIVDSARNACYEAGLDPEAYKKDLSDQGSEQYQNESPLQRQDELGPSPKNHKAPPKFAGQEQQMLLEHPNNIAIPYQNPEFMPVSFHEEDVSTIQLPYVVEHFDGDMETSTSALSGMHQSHDRVELWMDDIPEHRRRSWPEAAAGRIMSDVAPLDKSKIKVDLRQNRDTATQELVPATDYTHYRPAQLRRRSSDTELSSLIMTPIGSYPEALSSMRQLRLPGTCSQGNAQQAVSSRASQSNGRRQVSGIWNDHSMSFSG